MPRLAPSTPEDVVSAGFDHCEVELLELFPGHDLGVRFFLADRRGHLRMAYRGGHPIDLGARQRTARRETFQDGITRLVEGPDDRIVGYYPIDRRGPALGVAEISTADRSLLRRQREVERAVGRLSQRVRGTADRRRRLQELDLGLAWTAHELRGPLLATKLWLEDAAGVLQGDIEPIGRAIAELGRLAGNVESVLRWAIGDQDVDFGRVDLADIAREGAAACVVESGDDRVVVDGHEHLWVDGDAFHLRSAVENPIRNALRFSEPGTKVWVTVETRGAEPTIVIRNRALRSDPIDERIFEPFVRGRESMGAGIGLFVTRRVVERHGGSVQYHQTEDDRFELELRFPPQLTRKGSTPRSVPAMVASGGDEDR